MRHHRIYNINRESAKHFLVRLHLRPGVGTGIPKKIGIGIDFSEFLGMGSKGFLWIVWDMVQILGLGSNSENFGIGIEFDFFGIGIGTHFLTLGLG